MRGVVFVNSVNGAAAVSGSAGVGPAGSSFISHLFIMCSQ